MGTDKNKTNDKGRGASELQRWLGVIPELHDKNGNEISYGDKVYVWLPFWTTKMKYKGEIIYKDGEFRVGKLRDVEHNEMYKDYEPDNYVRLCDLKEVKRTKYRPNYGNVPDEVSKNLEYLEVI